MSESPGGDGRRNRRRGAFPIREPFAGGMEAHTHVLAERWARGHDVTVYAAGGDGPYRVHPMLPVDFEASPAARRDVSSGPASAVAEHHSYLDAVLEVCRRRPPDRAHQRGAPPAVRLRRALAVSVVTATLHTPPTPWLESALTLARARRGPPGDGLRLARQRPGMARVPIERVIHNGVDLQRWRPGPGGTGAVWWGRIVPEKAPHLAIDAARLAAVPIALVGPVHDDAYFAREVHRASAATCDYAGHLAAADVAAACGPRRGRRRDPGVGGAVRPRRRRGAGMRHAGRGVRPWRDRRARGECDGPPRSAG